MLFWELARNGWSWDTTKFKIPHGIQGYSREIDYWDLYDKSKVNKYHDGLNLEEKWQLHEELKDATTEFRKNSTSEYKYVIFKDDENKKAWALLLSKNYYCNDWDFEGELFLCST